MLEPTVFLIDDDSAVLDSLSMLIRSIGLKVVAFEHPKYFLEFYKSEQIGCLLLDIRMPGISGLTFQESLNDLGYTLPVIFITGHGDVAQCIRAFKGGAVDFLTKPIGEQQLIDSVQKAIASSIAFHASTKVSSENQRKLDFLTAREHEVLGLVVDGMSNKVIARQLDLSLRTVESHRANVFEKLGVCSLVECVKIYLFSKASLDR